MFRHVFYVLSNKLGQADMELSRMFFFFHSPFRIIMRLDNISYLMFSSITSFLMTSRSGIIS